MQSQQQTRIKTILNHLSENDKIVYNIVKDYPATKKDLQKRTRFPAKLLDKILRELSSYNLVKSIKRPQSKNINVWVRFDHQQQQEGRQQFEQKEDLMTLIRKKQTGCSVAEVQKDAMRRGIATDHFEQILTVMEMRGQVQIINGFMFQRKHKLLNAPCFECSLRDVCEPGGKISPTRCPYMIAW